MEKNLKKNICIYIYVLYPGTSAEINKYMFVFTPELILKNFSLDKDLVVQGKAIWINSRLSRKVWKTFHQYSSITRKLFSNHQDDSVPNFAFA